MDYDSLLKLVKKRRSIRKLKTEPIPDEYVDKIIEMARWAPSGANSQPWQFIVVKKEEFRKKIFELYQKGEEFTRKKEMERDEGVRFRFDARVFDRAPVYIIVCGDPRLKECFPLTAALSHGDGILESSLASAFLYMMLAATTLGLGAQWVSGVSAPPMQAAVKEMLGIPKDLMIYDMMAVGYPDAVPPPRVVRDKKELVHVDGYDQSKYATDKQVRDFIAKLRKSMPM